MRQYVTLTAIVFCLVSVVTTPVHSASINPPALNTTVPSEDVYAKISSMKIKDFQKMMGRKLTLKEKLGFIILKHRMKHKAGSDPNPGKTALTFSAIGAALLIIGLFVPYVVIGAVIAAIIGLVKGSIVRKKDSSDKNASAAILLGWITLGLFALFVIAAAIIIASWSWI